MQSRAFSTQQSAFSIQPNLITAKNAKDAKDAKDAKEKENLILYRKSIRIRGNEGQAQFHPRQVAKK
jgi:hypothetical protein